MSVNDSISYPHAKITYPIEFAHFANPFATITVADSTNDIGAGECSIPRKSTTDFYFAMEGMSDSGGQKGCTWMAIGYQLNGLIKQWGTVSQNNENPLISFSTSYTSEKTYVIVALKNSGTKTGDSDNDVRVYNKTEGSCNVYSSRSLPVEWIAIGYQLNGLIKQWGYIDKTDNTNTLIFLPVTYTRTDSYTIFQAYGIADNTEDVFDYPLCTFARTTNSFTIRSSSDVTGSRQNYLTVGY